MKIFELTIEDVEDYKIDIMTMLKQSFGESFQKENFDITYFSNRVELLKTYINENKAIVYGVKNERHLIGFIWFFKKENLSEKIIHINHFVVHENFRRQNIGKALWIEVEKYADKQGISEIELLVTKDNENAVNFYKRRNFEVERLVMKKRLIK